MGALTTEVLDFCMFLQERPPLYVFCHKEWYLAIKR